MWKETKCDAFGMWKTIPHCLSTGLTINLVDIIPNIIIACRRKELGISSQG